MGVLGQKSIARVDGVGVGDLGGADDAVDFEIAVGARSRADADGFVSELNVEAVLIGFGIDGDGLDADLLAGADDAEGDLAAIGETSAAVGAAGPFYLRRKRACPNWTGLPFSALISAMVPATSALISFITFMASTIQTTVSGVTS